jgi:cell wall assembly regulator SMI1
MKLIKSDLISFVNHAQLYEEIDLKIGMDNKFEKYIENVQLCQPSSLEVISEKENKLGVKFPSDYIEIMLFSNGYEGRLERMK